MMTSVFLSLDPSLRDGGTLVAEFDEVPVEFRLPNDEPKPSIAAGSEQLKVQIITYPNSTLLVQLLSETDVFFHFTRVFDQTTFSRLQADQQLLVGFDQFPTMLADLMGQAQQATDVKCVFVLHSDSSAKFDVVSAAHAFRIVELLSVEMTSAAEDVTQLLISFRYNALRARLSAAAARYEDLTTALKHQHPQLLADVEQEIQSANAGLDANDLASFGRSATAARNSRA